MKQLAADYKEQSRAENVVRTRALLLFGVPSR